MRNVLIIPRFAETVFEVVQCKKHERYFCLENDFQKDSSKFQDDEGVIS